MLICDAKVIKREKYIGEKIAQGIPHEGPCEGKLFHEAHEYSLNCTANPNSEVLICAKCGMGYAYNYNRNSWKQVYIDG